MFDNGVVESLLNGTLIDEPANALTLTHGLHKKFGLFNITFKPTQAYNSYTVDFIDDQERKFWPGIELPATCSFNHLPNQLRPSHRLLALHHAIAKIMHLSGAGECVDSILHDLEATIVRADGGTDLGTLVQFGLARNHLGVVF